MTIIKYNPVSESPSTPYPEAEASPNFPEMEEQILARWKDRDTFKASLDRNPRLKDGASNEFVFYDGPPFANGLPHYGHIATGFVKDLVPRYQTMRGKYVGRRFGWDCHGLPAELEVEKELNVSGAKAITELGIGKFNAQCQSSVMRFTKDWEWYVTRQARWVSFENDYKTMDLPFMESVMWAFKSLWDKGLVYEDYRVVAYSWAAQTPVSNSETKLDNSYRERADPALTLAFSLAEPSANGKARKILAWTTTPWTLPSNLALCVNPAFTYVIMERGNEQRILAQAAAPRYATELDGFVEVGTISGRDLLGQKYEPLFPYFKDTPNAFQIIGGDFVDSESGTGIVHIAPGFGEDDMVVARAYNIPVVVPVDEAGKFTAEVPDYEGQNVILEANANVIKDLKARGGVVLKHEQYLHNYPHCWRTDTPLIYKALNSWYVAVTQFRDRMVELNQQINWVPAHIKDGQFHNWLSNARDWNISRNRFWGAPIPVWKSDDPAYPRIDVYGSVAELERDFGVKVTDLHRPAIDDLVRPNPDDPTGKSMMRRVPEVLDCWFESGSMPFAQLHYPFENQKLFEENFPGDFIVEYVAQTRGWFYNLMVLSTALFDRAPFRNCVCHGVVLDENNQKLSKRLRNYPDPVEVFNTYGADAMRWYLLSSPLMSGGDLSVGRDGSDIAKAMRSVLIRSWNAYTFFTLYANADGITARARSDSAHVLDRYILSKTRELIETVQDRLDAFDIPGAYNAVPAFVDTLNNWYIRNRRPSFWAEEMSTDKQDAFDTLYTVLTLFAQVLAPMAPLLAERIYTALTGAESVHLTAWPDAAALPMDRALIHDMDLARDVCSSVLNLRETHKRRTRLPLKSMTVAHPEATVLQPYLPIMEAAVNVKDVTLSADVETYGKREVKVNPKIGSRIGSAFKDVLAAQRSGDWSLTADGKLTIAGLTLEPADFEMRIRTEEGVAADTFDAWRGVVVLDTAIYPDLQAEGWARDLIRFLQNARKTAGFEITDRITAAVSIPNAAMVAALQPHRERIMKEILATAFSVQEAPLTGEGGGQDDLDDVAVTFRVSRVS